MSNMGEKGTNSSQFYVTVGECVWLDHNNVVFGEVVVGQDIIYRLSMYGEPDSQYRTVRDITISDCGVYENSLWMSGKKILDLKADILEESALALPL